MNIIDMSLQIIFITYLMFPEATLPDSRFPSAFTRCISFALLSPLF